jgi:spermidine synthase
MSETGSPEPRSLVPVLVLALILAACSIIYELLAAQALSLLAANTVIWYSLVVGVFLGAMGIGAFFSEKVGQQSPWRTLLRVEIALTVLGSLTVPAIKAAHTLYSEMQMGNEVIAGVMVFYSIVFPVVFILGILTGTELPLVMRLAREIRDETRAANLALGWDYLGSLVGAMLFPLVIVTSMDLITAGLLIASINLLVAIWIWLFRLGGAASIIDQFTVAAVAACLLIAMVNISVINQYFLQRYYYYHRMDDGLAGLFSPRADLPEIRRTRSAYQVIDLVEGIEPSFYADFLAVYSNKLDRDPNFPVDQKLFLNGALQTDTRLEEVYH